MRWRALVCDIDGTLRGAADPCPALVRVLHRARAQGVRVLVATARRQASAALALGDLAWMAESGVFHGGAVIRCAATGLARAHALAAEEVHALVQATQVLAAGVRISVHGPDAGAAVGGEDALARRRDPTSAPADPVAFAAVLAGPVCKIAISAEGELDGLAAALRQRFPALAIHCGDGGTLVQVMAAGVTKERALAALLEAQGCAWSETIAVGDDVVDAGMLARAGCGLAMVPGHPAAQAAAREVLPGPPHDALAHRLEALLGLAAVRAAGLGGGTGPGG